MNWMDEITAAFQQFHGGEQAPAGTYFCCRTVALWQQTKDGMLPTQETFCLIEETGTASFAEIAAKLNAVETNTTFSAASFGVYEVTQ